MAVKAFEDFCKGPEILSLTNFSEQIKLLDDLYHEYSKVDSSGRYKLSNEELSCQKEKKIKTAMRYLTANLHSIPIPSIRHFRTTNTRFPWTDVPYFSDITVDLANGNQIHYRRNLKKYRSLNKRLRIALKTYKGELSTVQDAWRSECPLFCSEDFWKKYP